MESAPSRHPESLLLRTESCVASRPMAKSSLVSSSERSRPALAGSLTPNDREVPSPRFIYVCSCFSQTVTASSTPGSADHGLSGGPDPPAWSGGNPSLLTAYQALCALKTEPAQLAEIEPDRISFTFTDASPPTATPTTLRQASPPGMQPGHPGLEVALALNVMPTSAYHSPDPQHLPPGLQAGLDALKRGIKPVYTAVNAEAARAALDDLASEWGQRLSDSEALISTALNSCTEPAAARRRLGHESERARPGGRTRVVGFPCFSVAHTLAPRRAASRKPKSTGSRRTPGEAGMRTPICAFTATTSRRCEDGSHNSHDPANAAG
jgi:hypothetical protein